MLSLLMILMQPFGLSSVYLKHKLSFLLGYGLVTFLVLLINLTLVIAIFSEKTWTVLMQILWSLWVVFSLGLANYVYTFSFIEGVSISFSYFINFQVYTLFISIFPITILTLLKQNRLLKLNQAHAPGLNKIVGASQTIQEAEKIIFWADNGKVNLEVKVSDLAFVESVGNYIHIYHQSNHGITESVLRSGIAKIEGETSRYNNLIKCHRSFIVNVNYVEGVKGNAQGYRLTIKNFSKEVHVSRQYTKFFKAAMI